ncbi:MAG TPA: PaaI family thioesterase [Acidimicrobiales bacterium]|nr:PaaI family thioesterase [Acidimicrobiales bacterium]
MTFQVPPNCDLTLGLTCTDKSVPGRTEWAVSPDERFTNPAGLVQGGFIAAVMDSAMGASAVTAQGERRVSVSNTGMKVSFVRPVRPGDALSCVATVLKSGRSVVFVEARLHGADDRLVATASSAYVIRDRE